MIILSTVNPEHAFFAPDYYPDSQKNKEAAQLPDVGFDFKFKNLKCQMAQKEKKINDLEQKMREMEEMIGNFNKMSCGGTAEPDNSGK